MLQINSDNVVIAEHDSDQRVIASTYEHNLTVALTFAMCDEKLKITFLDNSTLHLFGNNIIAAAKMNSGKVLYKPHERKMICIFLGGKVNQKYISGERCLEGFLADLENLGLKNHERIKYEFSSLSLKNPFTLSSPPPQNLFQRIRQHLRL